MREGTIEAMHESSHEVSEAGRAYRCLSLETQKELARRFEMTPRELSILALENGFVPLRYLKNIGTIGTAGQTALLKSKVLVVGAGGIGGNASELLARMGVGTIALADPDVFEESNLNRQNFATEASLGLAKVELSAERLREINSDVTVEAHRLAAVSSNVAGLIEGADAVIDALDNIDDRLLLQEACRKGGVVMIHGAIAGSFVQAMTIFPGDPGLECLSAPRGERGKSRGIETETGNPATSPALAAVIQVQEAVKVITGKGAALRGRMLYLDLEDWAFDFIEL
ncbi:MAG: HesA/MoeB/ThiF family protein [Actinobacteria bacterium]|nr:HesA/MoeB/ThiF family protein [Actinomycetota bacterium]